MNWKKCILITADIAIAVYLILAVTVFNKPDNGGSVCTQVKIDISDDIVEGFLNADEIKNTLQQASLYPLARPMKAINVREIEENLRRNPFVDSIQCYKTQGGHVCITLSQRMPVMRIKADNGEDYYIDRAGSIMPDRGYATDIVVATGHISRKYARKVLTGMGNFIVNNRLWHNQIEQINVLVDGTVELVPRVGDHIVYIGRPENIDGKLARLEKFYRYGLSKVGWDKYSHINLEFDNQIICKKRNKTI